MKRNIVLFVLFILCVTVTGCQITRNDINEIYIWHSTEAMRNSEFKIDLKNGKFWKYHSSMENFVKRDASSENEGFDFVCALDDEKIEEFLSKSRKYGFTRWKPEYMNAHIFDGHHWGMTATFSDFTSMDVYGSNKYPRSWNRMYDAFLELTGENILESRNDRLKDR